MIHSRTERICDVQVTVLVADDHALFRNGIKAVVSSAFDAVKFLEVDDADSLMRIVGPHQNIRLAFIDLKLPGMHQGSRLLELARLRPDLPIIVISDLSSPDVVRRTIRIASVFAFLPKSALTASVRVAIESALKGQKMAPISVGSQGELAASLTPRQQQVQDLLRQGMSNKLIASTLGISEGTVKNHITEIFKALNATNRTQAAQLNL